MVEAKNYFAVDWRKIFQAANELPSGGAQKRFAGLRNLKFSSNGQTSQLGSPSSLCCDMNTRLLDKSMSCWHEHGTKWTERARVTTWKMINGDLRCVTQEWGSEKSFSWRPPSPSPASWPVNCRRKQFETFTLPHLLFSFLIIGCQKHKSRPGAVRINLARAPRIKRIAMV